MPAHQQGDILEDIELIENLEETKRTAVEIEEKVTQAKVTEVSISAAREVYRPVAARGSQVYFLIDMRWTGECIAMGSRYCSAGVIGSVVTY
jgi:dynein heavy chain